MTRTSEWVSPGHPDKIADIISSYILDKYMEKDTKVRYALEVMVKNNDVILGGEITSTQKFDDIDYKHFVKEAIERIGYTSEYNKKWGKNALCIDDVNVHTFISQQSTDISNGVNNEGWGDQGIFFGYAENVVNHPDGLDDYMPKDWSYAYDLGMTLYNEAKYHNIGGLDIKTQITYDDDKEKITEVIVAIPVIDDKEYEKVKDLVNNYLSSLKAYDKNVKVIINGTGVYKIHSSMGDCGITGRKLVVDNYGGNARIGGGSPWTKDATKADLTLNVLMRALAVNLMKRNTNKNVHHIVTKTSSCIGRGEFEAIAEYYDKKNNLIMTAQAPFKSTPSQIIDGLKLRSIHYTTLCMYGLMNYYDWDICR